MSVINGKLWKRRFSLFFSEFAEEVVSDLWFISRKRRSENLFMLMGKHNIRKVFCINSSSRLYNMIAYKYYTMTRADTGTKIKYINVFLCLILPEEDNYISN